MQMSIIIRENLEPSPFFLLWSTLYLSFIGFFFSLIQLSWCDVYPVYLPGGINSIAAHVFVLTFNMDGLELNARVSNSEANQCHFGGLHHPISGAPLQTGWIWSLQGEEDASQVHVIITSSQRQGVRLSLPQHAFSVVSSTWLEQFSNDFLWASLEYVVSRYNILSLGSSFSSHDEGIHSNQTLPLRRLQRSCFSEHDKKLRRARFKGANRTR